jgi:hypothetical protein
MTASIRRYREDHFPPLTKGEAERVAALMNDAPNVTGCVNCRAEQRPDGQWTISYERKGDQ